MNKDLILREKLAIERTDMAIDRTFLSFVRTSLYFAVAGLTINSLVQISYGAYVKYIFLFLSAVILAAGIYKFVQQKKKLADSKRHIGNYVLEWTDDEEL